MMAPSHDRSLGNLALKMVHSGGFENVNLLEGIAAKPRFQPPRLEHFEVCFILQGHAFINKLLGLF